LEETLISIAAVFVIGSVFLLERRCLGQMALVQPLVVCLAAGWFTGNQEVGIWLGVSLQLLSVGPIRSIDWALSGMVAAISVFLAPGYGVPLVGAGGPSALAIAFVAIAFGMVARSIERRYARIDGEMTRGSSPWQQTDPGKAIESHVYRVIRRWFVVGGLQITVGTALALFAAWGVGSDSVQNSTVTRVCAVIVPIIGVAIAVSSFTDYRLLIWTTVSAALSLVIFA
jgi:mannose/fructose/N-acetylgalactosamine-specific phosphotransferase system component IIC